MGLSDRDEYILVTCMSCLAFFLLFVIGWVFSAKTFPAFRAMEQFDKADWCSRINSSIHCIVIVPGFLVTLAVIEWGDDFWPKPTSSVSIHPLRCIAAVSLGYFAFDFFVLLLYRVPLWVVFVVHHIVASLPYYFFLFHPSCHSGAFVLGTILLCELATLTLNLEVFLDKLGMAASTAYTVVFYANFLCWFFSRFCLPIFCIVIYHIHVLQSNKVPDKDCLWAATICGHIIVLFCSFVFLFVITPDFIKRLRTSTEVVEGEMKKHDDEVRDTEEHAPPEADLEDVKVTIHPVHPSEDVHTGLSFNEGRLYRSESFR